MEKVFRDPVHNLMRFDPIRDRLVLRLLDCAEVQRLRNIRQMGLSELVFPGATHSRFSHSLGVTHLMRLVLEHMDLLRRDEAFARIAREMDEHRDVLLAAALLHDIGHFPFSHLMEEVVAQNHEAWSVRLIQDPGSEVHGVLKSVDTNLPNQIAGVLERTFKPSFVVKLISSQLDVDRMDYLLRDSFYTGVRYGTFDLPWLLNSLRIVAIKGDFEIAVDGDKGLPVAESYVLARYYMYVQVYLHKTERGAGAMLLKLLRRAKGQIGSGKLEVPSHVQALLEHPEDLDRNTFLALDDASLRHAILDCSRAQDPILQDLANRFLTRKIFKTVRMDTATYTRLEGDLIAVATRHGFDPSSYLHMDLAQDTPYKDPFFPKTPSAGHGVFVADDRGNVLELSEKSPLIRALALQQTRMERLCFPEELRVPILKLLEQAGVAASEPTLPFEGG